MVTWIETPVAFFKGHHLLPDRWHVPRPRGLLFGILVYEMLLGLLAGLLHPAAILLLAATPLIFLFGVTRPVWVYGLFILSIQFSNISFGQIGPYQLRVVDVGFFLLLGLFVLGGLSQRAFFISKTGIDSALWLFLGWIALSFVWSLDYLTGLEGLIKICIGVLTFYMTVSLISRRSELNIALGIWILAGLISAVAGILEFRNVALHHIQPGMTKWATPIRSQGFYGGPIMLGSFLTLSICINYGLVLRVTSGLKRILLTATCAIMIIGLLTTLSRNDIAAWFLVTLFFNYRFKQMRLPTAVVLLGILLIGLLVTGGALFTVFWNRFFHVFEGLEVSSKMRVEIWQLALKTIMDHPIHGVGLGGFPAIAAASERYGSLIYPHSLILYVMVEFGMIGFVLLTYMGVLIFRVVKKAEKGLVSFADKALCTAMTGGMLVHLFWTLSQNITFQHIIFWAFLGIAFASYHILNPQLHGAKLSANAKFPHTERRGLPGVSRSNMEDRVG